MNLYKWQGHRDGAISIMATLPNSRLIYMSSGEEAVLLHESDGGTVLPDTAAYQVLNAVGDTNDGYFAVFNNIPVSSEGKEVFESRFSNRAGLVEKEPGFAAIRVLRPINSDTYVILTLWDSEVDFKNWQESKAYGSAHAKRGTNEGIDKQPDIFPRPSHVQTFVK
ncbi:antibiotic biosynthesis monooxygenase family protein [Planococcus salinarum]|uniref:antibiotic biosynthesis monooxygenase family protein n=1 Tax=Planococcus salinarum TaxID=622695 RepID=UPI000E3E35E9|nr:antibiotic biosynthesis monooxygenase [Planococcus salinarum]TAA72774.1 antibiotic biosynthesis monooxygenase [Planococcus salinarum]